MELFSRAYRLQKLGDLAAAIELYRLSIQEFPTAEAHTFLGWTYRFQGRMEDAIAQCKTAISIDPSYGNPYNDIGAYLIEKGRPTEAIPWLEKATVAERYESYHFAWFNMGRAYTAREMYRKAIACYQEALKIAPNYKPAATELLQLKRMLQ